MIKKNNLKIKSQLSIFSKKIKKINLFKKNKTIYEKLNERYKNIKYEYLPEKPSDKLIKEHLKKDKLIVFLADKNRNSIVGHSKNISFLSFIKREMIDFALINFNPEHKNSLRNFYDIKKYNDFLINFSKQNNIKKISIETWIFEEFKGFAKYLGGYKPSDKARLEKYLDILKRKKVEKVIYYDFNKNCLVCINKERKQIFINVVLPTYILKV